MSKSQSRLYSPPSNGKKHATAKGQTSGNIPKDSQCAPTAAMPVRQHYKLATGK